MGLGPNMGGPSRIICQELKGKDLEVRKSLLQHTSHGQDHRFNNRLAEVCDDGLHGA